MSRPAATISIRQVSKTEMTNNRYGRDPRIDAKHFIPYKDNFFTQLELTQLKKTLFLTKEEEFMGAQIWTQTNEWLPGAREIGYDLMEPVAEARIGAQGGNANDIPFVSEKLEEKTQKAIELEVGIRYTRQEVEAVEARNQLGRGANVNIVQQRGTTARRAIARAFDQGIFQGYIEYGLFGLEQVIPAARAALPTDNNTAAYEGVPATGTGGGDAARRWVNKTGQLIIKDLVRGKINGVESGNIFKGECLIVDTAAWAFLNNPYSDLNGETIISIIMGGPKPMFRQVKVTNAVALANITRPNTYFVICDLDVDVAEIAILRPPTVFPSKEDFTQEVKQLVAMRFGGLLVKYPAGFYFADGHIETLA